MKFEKGNIVKHKGGGPKMVISSVESEGKYWCRWYSQAKNEFIGDSFEAEELELVGKSKS